MSKSLISGLQDALKEKRKKVERCEEALATARADVESYVAKISEALGIKKSKKPGPKPREESPGSAIPGSATRASGPPGSATRASGPPGSATRVSDPPGSATRSFKRSEVLRLFLDGRSRTEISDELRVSMASVYQHLSQLRKEGRLLSVEHEPEGHEPEGQDPEGHNPESNGLETPTLSSSNAQEAAALIGVQHGDGDDDSDGRGRGGGDSILALRAEVALQQAGVRSAPAHFVTTAVNGHFHKVVVDRMGDGSTQPDSTGHGHRFYRFVSSQTNKHVHDLLVPMKG